MQKESDMKKTIVILTALLLAACTNPPATQTAYFTHVRSDFYADFWGDGIRTAPKRQSQHTITLQPQSSLYILGQVMCANMYRRK